MDNNFFTLCQKTTINLADTYNCCIETCTQNNPNPHGCYAMCAQVFPNIKDRCALKNECWRDGFYNKKCLEAKETEIKQCCLNACKETRKNPYSYTVLDCERYCSDYSLR